MALSPRLLRPIAGGAGSGHPEALAWRNRVLANGGSVSGATLAAVSTFCGSIDAESGLRAAILRCNLFCGNSDASLIAVRTPLYMSGSLGGTTLGNALDTNFNFAAGDYQETGSGGGLKGNGTTKYLRTGVRLQAPFAFGAGATGVHLSCSATNCETTGTATLVGGAGQYNGEDYQLNASARMYSGAAASYATSNIVFAPTIPASESHLLGNRPPSGSLAIYQDGVSTATATPLSSFLNTGNHEWGVFAHIPNSTTLASQYSAARIRMYSIGFGVTAAQALAFRNAVVAFNTTLGRA